MREQVIKAGSGDVVMTTVITRLQLQPVLLEVDDDAFGLPHGLRQWWGGGEGPFMRPDFRYIFENGNTVAGQRFTTKFHLSEGLHSN